MKFSSTLFSLFFLSAFTSYLPSTTGFVVDTDGDPLRNGGTYYILPVIRGMGGGIGRTITGNETCPLTVVQDRNELSNGLPIIIASPYRIAVIYEGLILDLSFTFVPLCSTPSKFTIVKGLPEGYSVKLTGYQNTVEGRFKIEKSYLDYLDYKLVFCAGSSDTCQDIGIHIDDDGNRLLVLTENNPLIVQFKKVSSSLLLNEAL